MQELPDNDSELNYLCNSYADLYEKAELFETQKKPLIEKSEPVKLQSLSNSGSIIDLDSGVLVSSRLTHTASPEDKKEPPEEKEEKVEEKKEMVSKSINVKMEANDKNEVGQRVKNMRSVTSVAIQTELVVPSNHSMVIQRDFLKSRISLRSSSNRQRKSKSLPKSSNKRSKVTKYLFFRIRKFCFFAFLIF